VTTPIKVQGPPLEKRQVAFPEVDKQFFMPIRLRDAQGALNEPYRQHGWTYAVVRALALNISQVPFLIKTGTRQDSELVEEGDAGSEWVTLFDNPNPELSTAQLWEAVVTWLSLSGDCKVVKISKDDRPVRPDEVPLELWPENGADFEPLVDKATKRVRGWVRRTRGKSQTEVYEAHEICHIKYFNPYSRYQGMAPWEASELATRQDFKASQYNEAFFDNDATPGLVLVSKEELSKNQRDEIRDAWEDRHRGRLKRRRTAVLEGGLDLRETGATHREMEFVTLRRFSLEELLAIYKVPDSEVSNYKNLNFATAQVVDRAFWTKTLIPIMNLIEDALWARLFREPGKSQFWGEFDEVSISALKENFGETLDNARKARDLGYTQNEVNQRFELGFEEAPDYADIPLVPAGYQDAREFTLGPDVVEPQSPVGEEPAAPAPEPSPADETPVPAADEDEGETEAEGLTPEQVHTVAVWTRLREPERVARWEAVLRANLQPNEPQFKRRFRRYLIKLRAEQLKRLEASDLGARFAASAEAIRELLERDNAIINDEILRDLRDTISGVLFDENKWNQRLIRQHHPLYVKISSDAAGQVTQEIGGDFVFDAADPRLQRLIEGRERIFVQANNTIRKQLARTLETGVGQKESITELAKRVRDTFDFAAGRSLTIARTEVASMTNTVRHEVMEEQGIVRHEWITARDEAVRDSHREQDGDVVTVGDTFPNGLRYPNDPLGDASETINCRCVAVAVV